ncbi:unnamed protein product [Fusarium graminearum]|nr:unnamed protein product [Fusarium graminearum]VTO94012.1 unnamed protein product [Fusarium graminearum]
MEELRSGLSSKRSRTGCVGCRQKKLRCDEQRPHCSPYVSGEVRWVLVSTPHGLLMGPKFRRTRRPVRDALFRP